MWQENYSGDKRETKATPLAMFDAIRYGPIFSMQKQSIFPLHEMYTNNNVVSIQVYGIQKKTEKGEVAL